MINGFRLVLLTLGLNAHDLADPEVETQLILLTPERQRVDPIKPLTPKPLNP